MSESQTTHSHDATEGSAVPAPRRRRTKLGIVGAGAVGATLAYASLMRGAAQTVALYDINGAKVRAEALDLAHGIQFMPMAKVEGSDDVAVLADSDVIVFTAGAKQKPGQSRLDLAETTIGIVRTILPQLVEVAPDAVHIMVTNPVDVVTYAALQVSGLPPNQLFGSGTVLDSSRLRFLLAEHTGVAAQSIHAYVVGEHGDSELPLWSSASIGSVPLLQWRGERRRARARRADPRADRHRRRAVGLPHHRGQGRDELRHRPGRHPRPRGRRQRRGPHPAGVVAARRLLRHQRRLPLGAGHRARRRRRARGSRCR